MYLIDACEKKRNDYFKAVHSKSPYSLGTLITQTLALGRGGLNNLSEEHTG